MGSRQTTRGKAPAAIALPPRGQVRHERVDADLQLARFPPFLGLLLEIAHHVGPASHALGEHQLRGGDGAEHQAGIGRHDRGVRPERRCIECALEIAGARYTCGGAVSGASLTSIDAKLWGSARTRF